MLTYRDNLKNKKEIN